MDEQTTGTLAAHAWHLSGIHSPRVRRCIVRASVSTDRPSILHQQPLGTYSGKAILAALKYHRLADRRHLIVYNVPGEEEGENNTKNVAAHSIQLISKIRLLHVILNRVTAHQLGTGTHVFADLTIHTPSPEANLSVRSARWRDSSVVKWRISTRVRWIRQVLLVDPRTSSTSQAQ